MDPRTPCLIGVAQRTFRDRPAPEPLVAWEEVAHAAAEDAKAARALRRLDSIRVVHCESWPYDDPAGRLAERLGACPRRRQYSDVGGAVPGELLADTMAGIGRGELDLALVVGGEALATRRLLRAMDQKPAWSHRAARRPAHPMLEKHHPSELAHGVFLPVHTYALLEVARRAGRGETLDEEREARGAMMAPMTEVAAGNPHAWFPVARTPEDLVTPTDGNRLVGWPYTKYTCAVIEVDMAAAALVASTEAADALGVPDDRRLYLHGYAYGEDSWHLAARAELDGSPAMREASGAALDQAGIGLDDIAHIDLYSCFASALRFATEALGLHPLDPRGLTVTGGLPYAGGPASNYVLHSTAAMAEVLRRDPGTYGLTSGVGMHMAMHGYAVWSTRPVPAAAAGGDGARRDGVARRLAAVPRRRVTDTYEGPATIAACTVAHGRDGAAEYALLIVDLPDGSRAYARTQDPALLEDAESREVAGQRVGLSTDGRVNTATW